MNNTFDILTVSDMCVDLLLQGNVRPRFGQVEQIIDSYTMEIGGSANIFASQFAKLGGSIGIIGAVGDDPLGRWLKNALDEINIDLTYLRIDPKLRTGLGVAMVEKDDRAILTYPGTIDATGPGDLTGPMVTRARHWHIAGYYLLNRLREYWPSWIKRVKAAGATVSLDTNWDPEEKWDDIRTLLPEIDVFLPNKAEACAIAGIQDVYSAGQWLAAYCPLVVVKCGEEGALVFTKEKMLKFGVPSELIQNVSIIDATGAGDSFDAGFLYGWLDSHPIEQCVYLATRCGVSNLSQVGGIQGQYVTDHIKDSPVSILENSL